LKIIITYYVLRFLWLFFLNFFNHLSLSLSLRSCLCAPFNYHRRPRVMLIKCEVCLKSRCSMIQVLTVCGGRHGKLAESTFDPRKSWRRAIHYLCKLLAEGSRLRYPHLRSSSVVVDSGFLLPRLSLLEFTALCKTSLEPRDLGIARACVRACEIPK